MFLQLFSTIKVNFVGNIMQSAYLCVIFHLKHKKSPISVLTLGRTSKFIPPPWYREGDGWNPYPEWKAFDLPNKMRYILWEVALLEACDVTNNSRHLGRHLGFTKN